MGGFRRLRGNGEARSHLNNIFMKLYRLVYQRSSDLWVAGLVKINNPMRGGEGPQDPPIYVIPK